MRALLKFLTIMPLLLTYIIISVAIMLLPLNARKKREYAVQNSSLFSRPILRILGVRIHVKHRDRLHKTRKNCLIVSNHLSYVDVFILSSLKPSVFVTSIELRNTFLLGTIARLAGCIFVERRKATGLKAEIEQMSVALRQGFPVVLFPEGTTSDGDGVMQFKNSLFASAIAAYVDIIPLCIRYTKIDDKPLTQQNRDAVFYYGGVSFFRHLPRFLVCKSVDVEVSPLKTITVLSHYSRKDLAARTHHAISAAYHE